MSVLTPKRVVLFVVAALLGTGAYASYPSPRSLARMAWDTQNKVGVLFGGRGAIDAATGGAHNSSDTWFWTGAAWLQQFPLTTPPARGAHSMVYDSVNGRVYMFGGRVEPPTTGGEPADLNDLWFWQNGDWTRVETGDAPAPRHFAGLAYDSDRDRIILYGGNARRAGGGGDVSLFDTWEFDGSTWTRISADSPKVLKPVLGYDKARKETIMLALSETGLAKVMYRYDAAAGQWVAVTLAAEAMPKCVNEGYMVYQDHRNRLAFLGGICTTDTPSAQEVFEWDGTSWTKLTTENLVARGLGQAVMYESLRQRITMFGGTAIFGGAGTATTSVLENGKWASVFPLLRPFPRSLASFESDPARGTVWLFGGLDDTGSSYFGDLWGYRNGQWFGADVTSGPGGGCETPLSAFDTDRSKLVVTCAGSKVYEFDGTTWKSFPDLKKLPPERFYSGMVYDRKQKKTIVFGGYASSNYRNDAWAWNGTEWTEVKIDGDKPPHRGLMAMWYDPLAQKTIVYGGFGRPHVNERVTRYADMWALDGNRWTKLNPSQTPGPRFGPQTAIEPQTGRLLLFGGLRSENVDEDSIRQYFDNDTWRWDGAAGTWTRLEPQRRPDPRENGRMTWDPIANRIVLYGGYSNGFYLSDVWEWTGDNWEPRPDTLNRRRAARGGN